MNYWMASAGGLLLLTAYVHVFMGGPEIHDVIQASALDPGVRGVAAVIWHAITAILLVYAVVCASLAKSPNRGLALHIIAVQICFAALFVFYGLTLLGNLSVMPQWIIFLTIPAVMAMGLRSEKAQRRANVIPT
ncbi:hypothetical protein BXY66_3121 [Shimia isoporae]|uniref:DUF4383 domain-containing protein n=1 Tax=Shimia isoporae TaxID=647720 RepID=A0A4R1N2M7_9RHOB|nr:hypothetical protein [Shimia isoporae]TCL00478.1 hypothetical protein BXY66_3121 [Shimia isoporae]